MNVSAELNVLSDTPVTLDGFLSNVERRAFGMALVATRSEAEALDIVQDAMMKLVQKYRGRKSSEWPLLFQRILQNRILDWHRQRSRRQRIFWWQGFVNNDDDSEGGWIESVADTSDSNPEKLLAAADNINTVLIGVEQLPFRQQQEFMLRAWEEFSVADTAEIMGCSTGSVKTHYFRALTALRNKLEASNESA